eukprot:CCRYP_013745-RA/>CCRYP_013745-RA protein AED:0.43 eAED:0.43 QI:0/0/0/1/0/0/2/0/147
MHQRPTRNNTPMPTMFHKSCQSNRQQINNHTVQHQQRHPQPRCGNTSYQHMPTRVHPNQTQNATTMFKSEAQLEHMCNGVVHPVTQETITQYEKLANDPILQAVRTNPMCKELGRLAQGWDGSKGTDTIFFMTQDEIKQIPCDRTIT